jgi:hypothetical protein
MSSERRSSGPGSAQQGRPVKRQNPATSAALYELSEDELRLVEPTKLMFVPVKQLRMLSEKQLQAVHAKITEILRSHGWSRRNTGGGIDPDTLFNGLLETWERIGSMLERT